MDDSPFEYHKIIYFQSLEEMQVYMQNDFRASDAEEILNYSVEELMKGKTYFQGHRQGGKKTEIEIRVIHNENLEVMNWYFDQAEILNKNGDRIFLSDYIDKATNPEDIHYIINTFNNSWQDFW